MEIKDQYVIYKGKEQKYIKYGTLCVIKKVLKTAINYNIVKVQELIVTKDRRLIKENIEWYYQINDFIKIDKIVRIE